MFPANLAVIRPLSKRRMRSIFPRLLETMSTLKQAVPDMHIGVLLSGEVRDAYRRPFLERIDLPCDIEWQARDF